MWLAPGSLPVKEPHVFWSPFNTKYEGGAVGAGTTLVAGPLLLRWKVLPGALREGKTCL